MPFQLDAKAAKEAYKGFCKKKALLPRSFQSDQKIKEITGIYVPFWLFSCQAEGTINYNGQRIKKWKDQQYEYIQTDYYLAVSYTHLTMQYIKCDIETICIGMAASMGSFLLAGGTKGKRLALPNAEIMIHQPSGGAQGQATEIQIAAEHILKTRQKLNQILAENTGQPLDVIRIDTERDNFMSAEEAKAYGLIDEVIKSR